MYTPLQSSALQTRRLHLEPGNSDDMVDCRLIQVNLEDPHRSQYEAVSYVWSRLFGSKDVILDGNVTSVPASAEEVLRNVRSTDQIRIIWIDAVCIDQKNQQEKHDQLAMMGQIYSSAIRTIVWLGAESELTRIAIATLELIHNQVRQDTDDCQNLRGVLYGKSNSFQSSSTPLPPECTEERMLAVRELFRNPWFGRRWIIQEAALAPRGLVCCGSINIDLLTLFQAAVWIHYKQDHLDFDFDKESGMLNASFMSAHVDHEQGWFSRMHGQKQYLADLFRYFRIFEASVGHDRVYALLGLTQRHFRNEPLPNRLIPNYTRPLPEVLADATKIAIEESGDLWVFRYIDFPESPDIALPSWVPQLFRSPDPNVDPNHLRSTFNASKGIPKSFADAINYIDLEPTLNDATKIAVQGFRVDSIDVVGAVIAAEQLDNHESVADLFLLTLVDHRLDGGDGASKSPENVDTNERGSVLLAGTTFDPESVQTSRGSLGTFPEFATALSAASGTEVVDLLRSKASARYLRALRWAATNRRLFTTRGGHFGIGPRALRTNDTVVVLAASRMPMIMRRQYDMWVVVGPCYVNGIMQGQAVSEWRKGGNALDTYMLT